MREFPNAVKELLPRLQATSIAVPEGTVFELRDDGKGEGWLKRKIPVLREFCEEEGASFAISGFDLWRDHYPSRRDAIRAGWEDRALIAMGEPVAGMIADATSEGKGA